MKNVQEVDVGVVIAVREGSETAFRKVYDTYSARLYNFAYRFLKNPELCEEIVQETMISLWITRARLNEAYPLGAYLYTITRRLSLNMLRNLATSQMAFDQVRQSALVFHNETENTIIFSDLSCAADA
jgi:RNA polymerase sigma factor (sigma-70 family)